MHELNLEKTPNEHVDEVVDEVCNDDDDDDDGVYRNLPCNINEGESSLLFLFWFSLFSFLACLKYIYIYILGVLFFVSGFYLRKVFCCSKSKLKSAQQQQQQQQQ